MDTALNPLYFHLDYALLGEVFGVLLFLAFFVERALSLVFESDLYNPLHNKGLKSWIALLVAFLICYIIHFDMLAIVFHNEKLTILGLLLTAMVIAGGSKGVIVFTHDVLKIPNYTDKLLVMAKRQK